jgi:hypothetical protein
MFPISSKTMLLIIAQVVMIGFAMGKDNQLRGDIKSISMRSPNEEVSLESDVVEKNPRARQLNEKSKKSEKSETRPVLKADKKSKSQPVSSISSFRNQKFDSAECWDLLNQRWTQVVSEKVSKTHCLIDY